MQEIRREGMGGGGGSQSGGIFKRFKGYFITGSLILVFSCLLFAFSGDVSDYGARSGNEGWRTVGGLMFAGSLIGLGFFCFYVAAFMRRGKKN